MEECKEVIRQLKTQPNTTWSIELNSLSPDSLLTLLADFNQCPVQKLYIRNTHLDSNCVSELMQVVTFNETMEILELYFSPLLPDTYHLLTVALNNNKTLKELHLWYDNNISDNNVPHICDIITTNTTLECLSLYCPNITNFGIEQIRNVLVNVNSLKVNTLYVYINGHRLC